MSRAFTLMELLVVILILGIIIAILLPAMAAVRRIAREADTKNLMNQLAAACSTFKTDQRRDPGYFPVAMLGSSTNATSGFTAMKNILLDLSGGITTSTTSGIIQNVGPADAIAAGKGVNIDVSLIGSTNKNLNGGKSYFAPNNKYFVAQPNQVASAANIQVPDLVDSFGQPILAWAEDDRAPTAFAAKDTSSGVARFYWNENSAFLAQAVPALGAMGRPQTYDAANNLGSLISEKAPGVSDASTLEALLGNPAYPAVPATVPAHPGAPRGSIVFHSAGADGVFLSAEDRGGKLSGGTGKLQYAANNDALSTFDDIVVSTGN